MRSSDLKALNYSLEEVEEALTVGKDLLGDAEEELGGYAWEATYLRHRKRPEPHVMGDALEAFRENVLEPRYDMLDELINPEPEDRMAFRFGLKLLEDHRRHGPPNAGGRRDQPAWWLFAWEAVQDAVERAEAETRREDAALNKAKE